jgi:hypothetical protein
MPVGVLLTIRSRAGVDRVELAISPAAGHSALQEFALDCANVVLNRELAMLPAAALHRLETEWCATTTTAMSSSTDGAGARIARALASALVAPLLAPPGAATPKLTEATPSMEAAAHCELYWRCAVAVVCMPTASLAMLARHHADLQPYLAPADAPEAERHMALVRAVLPRFSMVCTTREEAAAAAKRKEEIEAMRRQRQTAEANERPGDEMEVCERGRCHAEGQRAGGGPDDDGVLL